MSSNPSGERNHYTDIVELWQLSARSKGCKWSSVAQMGALHTSESTVVAPSGNKFLQTFVGQPNSINQINITISAKMLHLRCFSRPGYTSGGYNFYFSFSNSSSEICDEGSY